MELKSNLEIGFRQSDCLIGSDWNYSESLLLKIELQNREWWSRVLIIKFDEQWILGESSNGFFRIVLKNLKKNLKISKIVKISKIKRSKNFISTEPIERLSIWIAYDGQHSKIRRFDASRLF